MKYEKYKDSGVEWLGEIPEHWGTIKLKNIIRAKITDGPHVTPQFIEVGIPFLSVDGIQNGELVFENCRLISLSDHLKYQKKCRIEKFDILMGKAASIGKIAQSKVNFEYSIWSPLALIKPNLNKVNATFLEYYLKSTFSQYQIEILCTSNTQKNISMDDIPKIISTIPPLPEQTAIAAFLDSKTALIDQAIDIKQKQIELLKERRQILIHKAVTRGLNPNVKLKDSGVEWIGEIPEGWSISKLGFYSLSIQTGPFGSQLHSHEYIENGVAVINPSHIIDGEIVIDNLQTISLEKYQQLKRHTLNVDDIVFGRRGEMGRCAMIYETKRIMICGTGSLKIELDKQRIFTEYLNLYLKMEILKNWFSLNSVGTTMENLNSEILGNVPILIPPKTEQIEIAQYIQNASQKIATAISLKEQEIEKLKEYKASLINSAVTGKIKVC